MPMLPFHVSECKGVLKGTQGEGLVHSNVQFSFCYKELLPCLSEIPPELCAVLTSSLAYSFPYWATLTKEEA